MIDPSQHVQPRPAHKAHGGGGGGAWKVAYADFVTAMMALFMVLWISSQDQEILLVTAQYFQNPFNAPIKDSYGVMNNGSTSFKTSTIQAHSPVDMPFLQSLAKELYKMLQIDSKSSSRPIDIQVTSDGLRIILFDRSKRPLFEKYSDELTQWGSFILQNMAWSLDRYNFKVRIDAFTPKVDPGVMPGPPEDYDPWDLTARRANAARAALEHYALSGNKIDRITGYGDAHPLAHTEATDAANQRLELSLVAQ